MTPSKSNKGAGATVAAALAAAVFWTRRHHRVSPLTIDTVGMALPKEPRLEPDPIVLDPASDDVAHAPGHRHLGPPPKVRPAVRRASWPRRADKNGHPPRQF